MEKKKRKSYQRKPFSEETKRKISATKRQAAAYPDISKLCKGCKKTFTYRAYTHCRDRVFCTIKCMLKHGSTTGLKRTEASKKRLSEKYKGKGNPAWKGGISYERRRMENQSLHNAWRKQIFERDNYTCVKCGARSGKGKKVHLNADHIKPYALFESLRYELSNGQTLCRQCHRIKTSWEIKTYWKNQHGQSEFLKDLPQT